MLFNYISEKTIEVFSGPKIDKIKKIWLKKNLF